MTFKEFSIHEDAGCDQWNRPTEAEWQYAARSMGKDFKHAWGDGMPLVDGRTAGNTLDEAANRQWGIKNYREGHDDGYAFTAPGDTFEIRQIRSCLTWSFVSQLVSIALAEHIRN
jgi:formylglycine-generating enzyme required for sulfatase activity